MPKTHISNVKVILYRSDRACLACHCILVCFNALINSVVMHRNLLVLPPKMSILKDIYSWKLRRFLSPTIGNEMISSEVFKTGKL